MFGLGRLKQAIVPESNKLNAVRDLLLEERKFTSDAFWLQQRANWLVFLYCDLQPGHPSAAKQCDPVWWGYSKENYSVFKNDLGKFSHPVAFERSTTLEGADCNRIKGQVVRMRTDRLIQLDVQRQNGVQFYRKRIPITVPVTVIDPQYNDERRLIPCHDTVWAWAYFGDQNFWLNGMDKVYTYRAKRENGFYTNRSILCFPEKEILSLTKYIPNRDEAPYYYFSPIETRT